ncbi:UMTA [Colletotrichum abscissum]|uniref:UMTA n=1 Tax=Colletotrichum abscissum TaxID=1671311 RepID=A0A9Q0B1S7_9PEZI|nr:UMTA [Colletotrichum abscissum]KAI3554010.1 UMTA [Colletotrichum abscissum]KAK1525530.1 UMTA [Colletotrichum abscissum]
MVSTPDATAGTAIPSPESPSPKAAGSTSSSPRSTNEPDSGAIAADPVFENEDLTEAETESIRTASTASISESITEYRRILGRTYTQKTDYWGPNDEKQNEGLDLAHYLELLFFDDKLFLAPIGKTPHRVLDVGTGTGIWAIDFADEFPSADVIGVDISPIQPGWVPPNCKFQIDDIEEPWTWPREHFNYVHIRHMEAAVSDWPRLYKQSFDHLVPGGYIEVNEWDIEDHSQALGDDLPQDHIYRRWAKTIFEATDRLGKTAKQTRNHGVANALRDAGFVDVVEKSWPFPIGGWASDPKLKECGAVNLEYLDQSLEGFGFFLLRQIMGWEDAEILVFISEMRKALRDLKLQTYLRLHVVYGRKPTEEEVSGEQVVAAPLP